MTLSEFSRALLAEFCIREAGQDASREQMRAIGYCMRARVAQGWHDGNWIAAIEGAEEFRANLPGPRVAIDPEDRRVQLFLREVDDIYFGGSSGYGYETGSAAADGSMQDSLKDSCYWQMLNEPVTPWFQAHVIDDPENHPIRAQMGLFLFYK